MEWSTPTIAWVAFAFTIMRPSDGSGSMGMEEMQMKAQLAIINGESIMSSGEYTVKEWDNIRKERLESDRTRMRFEAAVAAMQGLLSGELNDSGFETVAKDAVLYADALLERLEG